MSSNGYNNNYGGGQPQYQQYQQPQPQPQPQYQPRQQAQKANGGASSVIVAVIAVLAILIGIAAASFGVTVLISGRNDTAASYAVEVADDGDSAEGTVSVSDAYAVDLDDNGTTIAMRIPQIDLDVGDVGDINAEIYDTLYPKAEASVESFNDSGWPILRRMEYRWYLNGDILSLVIECEDETDYTEYTVYNISVSSGTLLTTDDILNAVGCSEELYLAGVENAVSDQTLELWNQIGSGDYETQLDKSLDADNIRAAVPYLDENGALRVIVRIWGFAGAESYYYDIPAEPAETVAADSTGSEADALFAVIGGKEYLFCSGAGAWSDSFTLNTDGTFSGYTADMDMGVGMLYSCNYTGTFGNVTKISDYEYTIEVVSLDAPEFEDYEQDGMTNTYTAPYGVAQGMTFHVYLPGMPTADMPSDYLQYGSVAYAAEGLDTFPCCGLYASDGGCYCETTY